MIRLLPKLSKIDFPVIISTDSLPENIGLRCTMNFGQVCTKDIGLGCTTKIGGMCTSDIRLGCTKC